MSFLHFYNKTYAKLVWISIKLQRCYSGVIVVWYWFYGVRESFSRPNPSKIGRYARKQLSAGPPSSRACCPMDASNNNGEFYAPGQCDIKLSVRSNNRTERPGLNAGQSLATRDNGAGGLPPLLTGTEHRPILRDQTSMQHFAFYAYALCPYDASSLSLLCGRKNSLQATRDTRNCRQRNLSDEFRITKIWYNPQQTWSSGTLQETS